MATSGLKHYRSHNVSNDRTSGLGEMCNDVCITNAVTGDVLIYDANHKRFENGPQVGGPPLGISFLDLSDTPNVYANALSLFRVNAAKTGLQEVDCQVSLPAANQFKITSGTTDLTATADCTLDQDLATTSSPQFTNLEITNKLTVGGLIDPTGLTLTPVAANPDGVNPANCLWVDSTGGLNTLRRATTPLLLGPASSTDTAVPRFSGTAGSTLLNSGVTIDNSNNVRGINELGVAGTITSIYSSTTAKILDVPLHATNHSYSYMGVSNNQGFLIARGGDVWDWPEMGIASPGSTNLKIGGGAINEIRFTTGNAPFGDISIARFNGSTKGFYHQLEMTYYNSYKDEDTMVSNDEHAVCSQQSIKAYVDTTVGATSSSGTHNTTWSGPWSVPPTGNITWAKSGKIVTLRIPQVLATADQVGSSVWITTGLPAALQASVQFHQNFIVRDNAAWGTGIFYISTDTIRIYVGAYPGTTFTNGAECGWAHQVVTYITS